MKRVKKFLTLVLAGALVPIISINAAINSDKDNDEDRKEAAAEYIPDEYIERGKQFLEAACRGDVGMVRELLACGVPVDFRYPYGSYRTTSLMYNTALMWAVRYGHIEVVRELIAAGANINDKDMSGDTSLMSAVVRESVEIVDELLAAGALTDIKSNLGNTILREAVGACNSATAKIEIVKTLLRDETQREQLNARDSNGDTLWMVAARIDNVDLTRFLLDMQSLHNNQVVDVNLYNNWGDTALTRAAQYGRDKIVNVLIGAGARVDMRDDYGSGLTALQRAVVRGYAGIVKDLLAAKARTDIPTLDGRTLLMEAAQSGHVEILTLLLHDATQAQLIGKKGNDGRTALMLAAQAGKTEAVNLLLKVRTLDLDQVPDVVMQENYEYTALMFAAFGNHKDTVALLSRASEGVTHIENGVEIPAIDMQNSDGYTALMLAAERGNDDTVQILIKAGASIDKKNGKGGLFDIKDSTALFYATREGRKNIVQMLLDGGAQVDVRNEYGETALMEAACRGRVDIVSMLLGAGAQINAQNRVGMTALMWAADQGHNDMVKKLCEAHAFLDMQDNKGNTALVLAAKKGHENAVKELIAAKANLDTQNNVGNTPLMEAVEQHKVNITEMLLCAGAQVNAPNNNNETALRTVVFRDQDDGQALEEIEYRKMAQMFVWAGAYIDQVVKRCARKYMSEAIEDARVARRDSELLSRSLSQKSPYVMNVLPLPSTLRRLVADYAVVLFSTYDKERRAREQAHAVAQLNEVEFNKRAQEDQEAKEAVAHENEAYRECSDCLLFTRKEAHACVWCGALLSENAHAQAHQAPEADENGFYD